MNANSFSLLQIIISILLIGIILLQAKGTGLGSTFGGQLGFYRSRRGFERILFLLTIILSTLFLVSSVIRLLL